MCEYMACGKPVIAAYNSGQRDVLTDENSVPIREMRPFVAHDEGRPAGQWSEPDLDEIIEHLEWAYQNRDALEKRGQHAGEDLAKLTWGQTAGQFLDVLNRK